VITEPIVNGTVTGPSFNATIISGLAAPSILNNRAIQVPVINLYGLTDDGYPFYLHETEVGMPAAQITRIVSCFLVVSKNKLIHRTYSKLTLVAEISMQCSVTALFSLP